MIKTVLKRLRSNTLHSGFRNLQEPPAPQPNRLRELLHGGEDFDILLINVRDFPLLRELYGKDLSQEIENQLTGVLRRAVNERLHTVPTCMTLEPGSTSCAGPAVAATRVPSMTRGMKSSCWPSARPTRTCCAGPDANSTSALAAPDTKAPRETTQPTARPAFSKPSARRDCAQRCVWT